jgi:hypothetical protein
MRPCGASKKNGVIFFSTFTSVETLGQEAAGEGMCPLVRLQRLASERQVAGPHYLAVAAAAEGDGREEGEKKN